MVGPSGKVIAVDLQPKMIAGLKRRAAKADLLDRLDARVTSAETMGIADLESKVDFTLAFAIVHEFPDAARFFLESARASKPGSRLLLAEPSGHVDKKAFSDELAAAAAAAAGFQVQDKPQVLAADVGRGSKFREATQRCFLRANRAVHPISASRTDSHATKPGNGEPQNAANFRVPACKYREFI